jgi:hypothetical protein
LVFGGEEVTSATEPTEGVVMEKLRHEGMILPFVRPPRPLPLAPVHPGC